MKQNRHEVGTIIAWANDGAEATYDSIQEAADFAEVSVEEIEAALGTDKEFYGVTYFRYGIDAEATKGYDDAWNEAEAISEDE